MLIRVLPEAANGDLSEDILFLKLHCPFHFLVSEILDEILLLLDGGDVNRLFGRVCLRFLELRDAGLDSLRSIAACDLLLRGL